MKKTIIILVAAMIIVIGYSFLRGERDINNTNKISVVTSFYPLYYFSTEIGGDKADVFNVTPAGGEPHDYEPTARDMAKIFDANLIVLNGAGFEAWAENLESQIKKVNPKIIRTGDNLANQQITEEGVEIVDPHIWLSPILAIKMVEKIKEGYKTTDPVNAQYYLTNAEKLISKLSELDKEYSKELASCKKRDIITSHEAFGYLASTYGLNQIAIAGISPEAEPSAKDLAEVAKFAKKNNVDYIFFETLISPKLSELIATEIGAKTIVLDPVEGITPERIAIGHNYFTEMRKNLENLKIALQCSQ